jgi:hypothetical protein
MERVRITYQGDFHHGMNRGINGEDIFSGSKNKANSWITWRRCLISLKFVFLHIALWRTTTT